MTDRKREPLPEGYQFGDAGPKRQIAVKGRSGATFIFDDESQAKRFEEITTKRLRSRDWNVIEGEHFSADIANYVPKLGD